MKKLEIEAMLPELFDTVPGNEYKGVPMYDAPICGIGSAGDALFTEFKKPEAIGPWYMTPREWLPGAESVVALFFPTSRQVRDSNREKQIVGSDMWAHARVDGQDFIAAFTKVLCGRISSLGYQCVYPQYDERFEAVRAGEGISGYDCITEKTFSSRWSERHAAYVCGLGTFGLSKGLITAKGMAGRFATFVTDAYIEPDARPYSGIYDYCINCGKCAARCPANAIDPKSGKDHSKCFERVTLSRKIHEPRYGCGLCQVDVPCEACIPVPFEGD